MSMTKANTEPQPFHSVIAAPHQQYNYGKTVWFQVICILGETLQPLDEDGLIPAYGFGDAKTKGDSIFPLKDYVSIITFGV